jgi:uncharacterized protein YdeI (BOF family)
MRTAATVTTLSRLCSCPTTAEFGSACKQDAQFLPRSKQSGFQGPDPYAQNLGCFSDRSFFQPEADDGPQFRM